MAWYSYFLMNVPESLIMLALPFVLFGISIRSNLKSMLIFAFLQGSVAFILSTFLQTSLKPFLTLFLFFFLVFFIFRFQLLKSLVITLTSFIFLVIFEIITTLSVVQFLNLSYEELFNNSWMRIMASLIMVQIPMILTIILLLKFNLKIKLPAFLR